MNLRISIILTSCLFCGTTFAFTSDEAYKIAYEIVYRVSTSDECNDCYDEAFVNMKPTPYYPSVESVMEAMSRSTYTNLTVGEIAVAFDTFLNGIAQTNSTNVSERYLQTAGRALTLCEWKGYTNSLPPALSILESDNAPCKEDALDIAMSFLPFSVDKTRLVYTVMTNSTAFSERWRYRVVYLYKMSLCGLDPTNIVVSNAANLFYRNRVHIENLMSVDEILKHAYPSYTASSNRLILCNTALSRPGLIPHDIAYYSAITNELANAPQPLGRVPELDADSDESETE